MADDNKITDELLNAVDIPAGDEDSVINDETVTDGAEDVVPETVEELQKELQKERSKLGRRVSAVEREAQERNERMDSTLDRLDNFMSKPAEDIDTGYDTDPVTKAEVADIIAQRDQKKNDDMEKYRRAYQRKYNKLGQAEDDPALFEAIEKEMRENFNNILSGDPSSDAERNYLRAARSVLKKSGNGRKNPLKGEKPEGAIGVGGDTKIDSKKDFVMPKLDEHASAFMQYADGKMSDKAKERALTGEGPANLRK